VDADTWNGSANGTLENGDIDVALPLLSLGIGNYQM
jgi:hypothetical protein